MAVATRLGDREPHELAEHDKTGSAAPTSAEAIGRSTRSFALDWTRIGETTSRASSRPSPSKALFVNAVLQELSSLKIDAIHVIPRKVTERLSVTSATSDEIRLRQIVTVNTEYRDENGNDVTIDATSEPHTVDWILRPTELPVANAGRVVTDVGG